MKIVLPLIRELNFEGQRGFQKRGKRQPQCIHPKKHSKTELRRRPIVSEAIQGSKIGTPRGEAVDGPPWGS